MEIRRLGIAAALLLTLIGGEATTAASVESGPLRTSIQDLDSQIARAEAEDAQYTGGLVKSLVALRLATLKQSRAMLEQRLLADDSNTHLIFTVSGRTYVPPADSQQEVAALESKLAELALRKQAAEKEAAKYSGGLVQATTLATVATIGQTEAMVSQKLLALRFGLPQFIGFDSGQEAPGNTDSRNREISPTSSQGRPEVEAAEKVDMGGCLKVAFSSYCLGGMASSLPPGATKKDGDAWLYPGAQTTFVRLFGERVAAVGRIYLPGTWLTYRNLQADLESKYGPGKDLSFYPKYADDDSSRETAIGLKEGRAALSWPQEGYTVQLNWGSRDGVLLLYFHDALEAEREAKKKEAL